MTEKPHDCTLRAAAAGMVDGYWWEMSLYRGRKMRTWERIARRRAEIIASQSSQLDGFARALTQSNDEKDKALNDLRWEREEIRPQLEAENRRLLDTLTAVCKERDEAKHMLGLEESEVEFVESALHEQIGCCAPGGECDGVAVEKVYTVVRNRLKRASASDDSGREYPQAWQPAGLPDEVIYRQGEGWPEFWGPSIPGAGLGWCRCGDAFRTMDDINAHWAKRARVTLVKVPSPDCKNCNGTGTVRLYAGESYDCPVCCGGR